ncbi:hypothetical protein [Nocardia carnea]|uniref:hypothetical protein n=1 Tax=Nocardia carnea TaxID=37328 RepID=UPI00245703D7|nr:hypothetical protein [Nocardia carnea]
MSRRHQLHRAPVEHKVATAAFAEEFNEKFLDLLQTVIPNRTELVRHLLNGVPLRRIAVMGNLTLGGARRWFSATVDQLMHPSRPDLLRAYDLDEDDFAQILKRLTEIAEIDDASLTWCDFHGWTECHGMPPCPACQCELPAPPDAFFDLDFGRPRRYCSNACRQRAYRRRRKAAAVVNR